MKPRSHEMSNRTLGACLLLAVCHYVFPTQKLFEASVLLAGASLEEGIGGGVGDLVH